MPREWRPVGMVAFQVRIPLDLKRRLVAMAAESGQSQQAIVTQALESYFHERFAVDSDAFATERAE